MAARGIPEKESMGNPHTVVWRIGARQPAKC
jgi:hypothetical protein